MVRRAVEKEHFRQTVIGGVLYLVFMALFTAVILLVSGVIMVIAAPADTGMVQAALFVQSRGDTRGREQFGDSTG